MNTTTRGFNEWEACNAVRRHLERAKQDRCTDVRSPDKIGEIPPVDLRCTLGREDYALEHTGIPLYRDQLREDAGNEQLWTKLQAKLAGRLPGPGLYTIVWPHGMRLSRKNRTNHKWLKQLATEIITKGTRCHAELSRDGTTHRQIELDGATDAPETRGFELVCWGPEGPCRENPAPIDIAVTAPPEMTRERSREIEAALEKKLPKLKRAKEEGATTVLVLETTDFMYTDAGAIIRYARAATAEHSAPDQTYLVETRKKSSWWIWDAAKREGYETPAKYCQETRRVRDYRVVV